MRGIVAVWTIVTLFLGSFAYAQNPDISIYVEDENSVRDFGDIVAGPGEFVNAFIQVENTNKDRSNKTQEIEDIEIKVRIEDIDDGVDIDDEFSSFDLKADRDKSLSFPFQVPLRIEDASFDMIVEVDAKENRDSFSFSEDFSVTINKKRNDIRFRKLGFDPPDIMCNEVSNLEMEILDLGTADADVVMKITNDNIGFSLQRGFLLEQYPGEDRFESSIPVKMPADTKDGTYIFKVSLSYPGFNVLKEVPLMVSCSKDVSGGPKDENERASERTSTPSLPEGDEQQETQPKVKIITNPKQVVSKSQTGSGTGMILLAAGILIALVLVAILKRK